MPRALKVCSTAGCPELCDGGRCAECRARAEQVRGSAAQRGYNEAWRRRRRAFLSRPDNLFCPCGAQATVADHHPTSRRDLIDQGVTDPDAEHRLRALCATCHNRSTSRAQPGGWNMRHA